MQAAVQARDPYAKLKDSRVCARFRAQRHATSLSALNTVTQSTARIFTGTRSKHFLKSVKLLPRVRLGVRLLLSESVKVISGNAFTFYLADETLGELSSAAPPPPPPPGIPKPVGIFKL